MKSKDLVGKTFGLLKVLEKSDRKAVKIYWICKCECGNTKEVRGNDIVTGRTRSCGCIRIKVAKSHLPIKKGNMHNLQHGLSYTKFYRTWLGIKNRCNYKNHISYKHYGARGIKCLWESFKEFKDDMYESFLEHNKKYGGRNTSIERIDVNGNYCKENCTWATMSEQQLNKQKKV